MIVLLKLHSLRRVFVDWKKSFDGLFESELLLNVRDVLCFAWLFFLFGGCQFASRCLTIALWSCCRVIVCTVIGYNMVYCNWVSQSLDI